ncbi:MAG TPA: hypothetical protein VNJ53_00155 [Gaiellaceae bacterium]|nr:hypothetical protein [Gaiellaceae bacterium]
MADPRSPGEAGDRALGQRLEALARWVHEIETRVRAAEAASGDEDAADELRRALAQLGAFDPGAQDRLSGRVEALADRLATLSATVSTTASGLAGKDGDIASLRRELEEGRRRIDLLAVDLRRELDPARVDRLQEAVEGLARDVAARYGTEPLDALTDRVDILGRRLDTLAASVASTASGLAGRESELAVLRQRLDEAMRHLDRVTAEVARHAGAPQLGERLEALAGAVAHVSERIEAVERGRADVVAEAERTLRSWADERAWLRERLDALADVQARAVEPDAYRPELEELAERLSALEHDRESAALELARVAESLAAEQSTLREHVDALAHALAASSRSGDAGAVASLAERLDGVEREAAALSAELARAGETERALHALAQRLEAMERATPSAERPAPADELAQLRVLVDGLRMRVATSEKELTARPGGELAARLDELTRRLETLESESLAVEPVPPVPGDGRFRMELRSLELRLQHLEQASRESREAVLTQLERLASRMEWRMHRMEAEQARPAHASLAPVRAGNVVPLRRQGT